MWNCSEKWVLRELANQVTNSKWSVEILIQNVTYNADSFGFNDGISHPQVFGVNDSPDLKFKLDDVVQSKDSSNFVDPGVILVGRHGDENRPKPQWMKDGSFLVFRKLEQHVGKWNDFVVNRWKDAGSTGPAQFGAQLMGRWQSGRSISAITTCASTNCFKVVPSSCRTNEMTVLWL